MVTNILNAIVVVLNGGPTHSKFGLTYFSSLEADDDKILGVSLDHSNEDRARTLKDEKRTRDTLIDVFFAGVDFLLSS